MICRHQAVAYLGVVLLSAGLQVPARAQSGGPPPVRIEVGFGLGALNRTTRYHAALQRAYADGFRVIRVYEPFLRGDSGAIGPVVDKLRYLDSLGFRPYFDLSDFPHALAMPSGAATDFPAAKRDAVFRYSNRYPPASAKLDSLMTDLIGGFDRAFGRDKLRHWYFEFGNEPDASLYFWGSPDDFSRLLGVVEQRFRAYDPTLAVGGGAFTSGLVHNPGKSAPYAGIARTIAADPAAFVSVHVYGSGQTGIDYGARINGLLGPPDGRLRVISEWNVTEKTQPAAAILSSPDAIGPYLIDMLAGAADGGVRLVLVHKLMDDPGDPQLGLFDHQGQPKPAYDLVRRAAQMARRGFTVVRTGDGAVQLEGARQLWVEAGQAPVPVDAATYEVVAPAPGLQVIPPHGWALLRRRGASDSSP